MKSFADTARRLVYTPQRNAKLRLIERLTRRPRRPDRGYGLAALTGDLALPHVQAGDDPRAGGHRVDPLLFALSYDYVGDLAETVALIWPVTRPASPPPPRLARLVGRRWRRSAVTTPRRCSPVGSTPSTPSAALRC